MSDSLTGRNAVVFGVANKRSIAWSIAQGLHGAGARLAITYQNERLEQEAKDLILSLPGAEAFRCDVSQDQEVDRVLNQTDDRQRPASMAARCLVHLSWERAGISYAADPPRMRVRRA